MVSLVKPPDYYYTFVSDNGLAVVVLRDETPPHKTGGVGGWQVVDRRRRRGLTSWTGRQPLSIDVPVLFDGWFTEIEPESVDGDVSILNLMALGDNFIEPPKVRVEGLLPAYGVTWVISDLQWGTNTIWIQNSAGDFIRVRQDCVVSLLQFVDEDVVRILNKNPLPSTYTTRVGDTLKSIAKTVLGSASKWKALRSANPSLHDPNVPLPPGVKIIIPS